MPKTSNAEPTADEIAELATAGEDVSPYFTNEFRVVRPVQRIGLDLTPLMLEQLDAQAARINVSREALMKLLLAQGLAGLSGATARQQTNRE